jgi:hypothetical protein
MGWLMASLTDTVIAWLTTLTWDQTQETGYPFVPGNYPTEEPDRLVFITATGGPGYVTDEGSADAATFQIRLRAPADSETEAEGKAEDLDLLILQALYPVVVNGVRIQHVHRLGGRPAALPVSPDDLRYQYTCNYVVTYGVM